MCIRDRDDILLAGKTGTAEIKASTDDTSGTELGWFAIFTAEDTVERPISVSYTHLSVKTGERFPAANNFLVRVSRFTKFRSIPKHRTLVMKICMVSILSLIHISLIYCSIFHL